MSVTRIICEAHKCAVVHCGCSHPAVAYSIEQTPPIITTNVCPWTDNQQQCYWHEHDLCQPGQCMLNYDASTVEQPDDFLSRPK